MSNLRGYCAPARLPKTLRTDCSRESQQ